jgi:ABC-2 type transport system ATP-binding protein
VRLTFTAPPPAGAFDLEGVEETERDGQSVTLKIQRNLDQVLSRAASLGISDIETIPVTLEEIFLAFYGKGNGGNHA